MKEEYDLSQMKAWPNPYAKRLKRQITLPISPDGVEPSKSMAEEAGVPCRTLTNLYLQDCMASQRKLHLQWSA